MKNKELQELLKQFPDDLTVWIDVSIRTVYVKEGGQSSTSFCQHMLLPTSVQIQHGVGFSTISLKGEVKPEE